MNRGLAAIYLRTPRARRGAAMVEFVVLSPWLVLIGLAILQYSLLYVAKNQVNHAGFMAARAGSMHNATVESISTAYLRSLAPLYGGGGNPAEIAAAVARATADMKGRYRIELINPTKASFDDFNDPALQKLLKTAARVIPNRGLAMQDPADIRKDSKQNIFDANLLKLRITHGYQPKVPLVAKVFAKALAATRDGNDVFTNGLLEAGRIPVVIDITLHMNSDAINGPIRHGFPAASRVGPVHPARRPRPPRMTARTATATAATAATAPATGRPSRRPCPTTRTTFPTIPVAPMTRAAAHPPARSARSTCRRPTLFRCPPMCCSTSTRPA